jgi:hypothetical protein
MERAIRLLVIAAVTAIGVLGAAAPASAGGWAITSLDEMPSPRAGEDVAIGFTILQHGVTPVAVDDVRIEVTSASGTTVTFPAVPDGPVGHYVATVVFDEPGAATWTVHQGWFGEQQLGTITVGGASAGGGSFRAPGAIRFGLPVLAALLAAVAVGDALAARRRRSGPRTSVA